MTHYDTLGLSPNASADEIDDAYRALAKVVHPDAGGDALMFTLLNSSYEVLADAEQRAAYDSELQALADPSQPVHTSVPAKPMSLFDQVAMRSYEKNQHHPVRHSAVSGCLSDVIVIRLVALPVVSVGLIVMFLVPFFAALVIGGLIVLVGLLVPLFVEYGFWTASKKDQSGRGTSRGAP